jgi:anti-sigma regulatory factor (Ser/Thr protein kinase)
LALLQAYSKPAVPESVPEVRRRAGRFASRVGASCATVDRVKLAVSEAATNVVLHAYADADELGAIHVAMAVEGGELIVGVADSGGGLRACPDGLELGLGLAVIDKLADALEVHDGDNGGLRLLMRFSVNAPTTAGP